MASSPQNVRNELVLSEPRKSSMEWIAEMTELNSHDFVCFCFCGVLDIGELTSWRNPNCYLTQWFITGFFWHLYSFWFPLYLLRGPGPSQTIIRDLPSSFPIVLPLPTCLKQKRSSVRPGAFRLYRAGRLTHTAQPKPDFGTRSNFWQKYNLPWNPHPKSQDLKKNIFL